MKVRWNLKMNDNLKEIVKAYCAEIDIDPSDFIAGLMRKFLEEKGFTVGPTPEQLARALGDDQGKTVNMPTAPVASKGHKPKKTSFG